MPNAVPVACSFPRCPDRAVPNGRGRCERHKRSEIERGYGTPHKHERRAALPGARCAACGCTSNLERDHKDPTLRGPDREGAANKRWLCRCPEHGCHDRYGARSDRPGSPLPGGRPADGEVESPDCV